MSYINTSVSTNSDEKTFIKTFVATLTQYPNITAVVPSGYANFNAYIDAQFELTSGYPTFSLKLCGFELEFRRNSAITSGANGYIVSTSLTSTSAYLNFRTSGAPSINTVIVRAFKICIASNNSITYLSLGSHNSTVLPFSAVGISLSSTNSACAVSNTDTIRAINSTFTDRNGNAVAKIDRCNYLYNASNATSVEVIKSKVFVTANSASRAFTTTGLWDVSTVPAEATINIDTKQYYALDAHTIMEV